MFDARPSDTDYVRHRVSQFRAQVARRLDGSLTEEEFRPLRLMNGVYLQLHAYMLRIAIPYGTLNPDQMRMLAYLAEHYDKGYGHWTTRTNMQFNWPKLVEIPDMLDHLASVNLHAIQTSGNTIRNTTTDAFAGAAADEITDPRPYAELIRKWSTDHAEFQFLPRKFKIAISGGKRDRALVSAHDIGLRIVEKDGQRGFEVWVGGGLGRTPMLGSVIRDFLPEQDLLPYLEAIIATYNLTGRRDNKYKARIKITVSERGLDVFKADVEDDFKFRRLEFHGVDQEALAEFRERFAAPAFRNAAVDGFEAERAANPAFRSWTDTNLHPHKIDGYASVIVTFKAPGATPGDASAEQMHLLAELAEKYGHDDIRVSHDQNVVLPHVHKADLPALYLALREAGLATANAGKTSDIIACPGMDYCTLATARSIPIAQEIAEHFRAVGLEDEIGKLNIRISGCINACGHHHLGHIGILGLDRAGVENYQITLGGDGYDIPAIGQRAGAGFPAEEVVPAIDRLLRAYLEIREDENERFIDAYRRLGPAPFKAALYPETVDA
ncbi:nitrite/sulfite reductase [Paracoccus onubensis]|uniref:Nitrite/sulfite reductase n=1 Tax=Paracoccus onubensis TaxID=1675788 RepID=A0A418SS59_9RHOB|nr:nitrite/sulfite reductase [Paracoccus onubensis]RJE83717.1 nitrite/sulfite reductase [Paracoccus onubensis]